MRVISSMDFVSHVIVVSAITSAPFASAQQATFTFFGDTAGDRLGRSVAAAGDLDGDGWQDVCAGAFLGDVSGLSDAGYVRAWSGRTGAVLFTFAGTQAGEMLGFSVSSAGDYDGDGVPDILGGSFDYDAPGKFDAGSARVISGATGQLIVHLIGTQTNAHFGFGVGATDDVDLDGRADILIGAPMEDGVVGFDSGFVRLLRGGSATLIRRFEGASPFEEFGRTVVGGDFDNDGRGDLAVGAWHADQAGTDAGAAYLYSGMSGVLLRLYTGDTPVDFFGISVDNAFDIDLDGYDDVIVGSHHDDPFGIESGSARVFSTFTGALLHKFDGEVPDMYFGRSVAGLGDVDGDGVPDVEAGTPFLDNATSVNHGLARVFSGKTGAQLYQLDEDSPNDLFAFAVDGVGDTDGNGYPDLVIGARDDDDSASNAGSVRIYNGCSGTVENGGNPIAGSGGFVPQLSISGCPRADATVTLSLVDGLGGALAEVLVAPTFGITPLPLGDALGIALPIYLTVPIVLSGAGAGQGIATIVTPLPATASGVTFAVQAVVVDPAAAHGLALSNALQVEIG